MALKGIRVVEFAGLAPAPFCGMILSDFGANVIRIDKTGGIYTDTLARGKQSICIDLKRPEGRNMAKKLCSKADVLIEPYRKGVMEHLGLGPDTLLAENPRLIYARLTGYGQKGPLSARAGHDINYLAVSGILSRIGRKDEKPYGPINLLGDFAGGSQICATGILLALLERNNSGKGQVIDANIVEGAAYVSSFVWHTQNVPIWEKERGSGWLDGGAPWYDTYRTADGKYMAVGAVEAQFYKNFITGLGLAPEDAWQFNNDWTELREKFTQIFASKTQAEWCKIFDDVDACVTPVLEMEEAPHYPHNVEQGTFREKKAVDGYVPRASPTLSRTPAESQELKNPEIGEHSVSILQEMGYTEENIKAFLDEKLIEQANTSKL